MSRPLRISLFENERDNKPKPQSTTWPELVAALSEHDRRASKSGPAWSAASYPERTTRGRGNVLSLSVASFDLDKGSRADFEALWARLAALDLRFVAHTTHSSTTEEPRWRLVFDLSRDVSPEEWPRVFRALVRQFSLPADENAKDASRVMFAPSCRPEVMPEVHRGGEEPVDVDQLLCGTTTDIATPGQRAGDEAQFPPAGSELLQGACDALWTLGPAIEGHGGDKLTFRACALLRRDFALTEEESWPLLVDWNRSNQPPWSEHELRTKLGNAAAYASGEFGAARSRFDGSPFDRCVAQARSELQARAGRGVAARGQAFSMLSSVLDSPEPPVEWLVESLIAKNSVVGIGAEPKAAKTWLALTIAAAVASGRSAFGEFRVPKEGLVALFMAEDGQASVKTRLRALARGIGLDLASVADRIAIRCRASLDLRSEDSVAWIVASCRDLPEPPALVVFDPLRDIHSADENDSGGMSEVMDRLRAVRDLVPCSVLFIHHSAKQSADSAGRRGGQRMRGSSVIHGAVDGGLYLSGLAGDLQTTWTNAVETEVKGARSAGKFYLRLTVEDDFGGAATNARWEFSKDELEPSKTEVDCRQRVLEVVRANASAGGGPLSGSRVAKDARMKKHAALRTLEALQRDGVVERLGKEGWGLARQPVPLVPPVPGTAVANQFPVPPPIGGEPEPGRDRESRTGEVAP